jgi:hypothetical protein
MMTGVRMTRTRHKLSGRNVASAGSAAPWLAMGFVLLVLAGGYLLWPKMGPLPPASSPVSLEPASNAPAAEPGRPQPAAPTAQPRSEFLPLAGRWLRPDGGYVLQIRGVDAAGKLDAGYFNPRPIHVAGAEALLQGKAVKVLVELRDEGYPGCTYTLTYDPAHDRLLGTYYQAAMNESFDVLFERMK